MLSYRFVVFMAVSTLVLVGILAFVVRGRERPPSMKTLLIIALAVAVGGMLVAKIGAASGLSWWLFYSVPALATVVVPPTLLRMNRRETVTYLTASLLSAPAIHVMFSLLLGWGEYMPFVRIPSIADMLAR